VRFVPALLCTALLLADAAQARAPATAPPSEHGWARQAQSWITRLWSRDDSAAWLAKIGSALRENNYQGTLVQTAAGRIETVAVFHAFSAGRERERLVTLSGPHREVIRDDKMVMCIGTGDLPVGYDAGMVGTWNPGELFADAARLPGYQAKLGGVGRVAGLDAQIVELRPRDDWRYGYRFWLEKNSGLPLQIALLDGNGHVLERIFFTQLQLGKKPAESDLAPSTQKGLRRVQTLSAGKDSDPGWRVNAPPEGFNLRAARRLGPAVQLLYSDGLASVSVYVEPIPANASGATAAHMGAVTARSYWGDGRRVVAIGKVPEPTVDYFARNLQPLAGKSGD
jgi:sigma-E factor negative regulatory protein RseB